MRRPVNCNEYFACFGFTGPISKRKVGHVTLAMRSRQVAWSQKQQTPFVPIYCLRLRIFVCGIKIKFILDLKTLSTSNRPLVGIIPRIRKALDPLYIYEIMRHHLQNAKENVNVFQEVR